MKTDEELLTEANALDAQYAEAEQACAVGAAEAYERDARELVRAAHAALADMAPPPGHQVWESATALKEALDKFEPWLDQEDENDYRGMGWVDDRGRP